MYPPLFLALSLADRLFSGNHLSAGVNSSGLSGIGVVGMDKSTICNDIYYGTPNGCSDRNQGTCIVPLLLTSYVWHTFNTLPESRKKK